MVSNHDANNQPEEILKGQLFVESAKYVFGTSSIDQMREVINGLINKGVYFDSFYDVLYPDYDSEQVVGPAFERALVSLGVTIPDYESSVWIIIRYYLNKIASTRVDPYEGLSELMKEMYWKYDFHSKTRQYLVDSHGLQNLIGLYWAYDDLTDTSVDVSFNEKVGEEAVEELKKAIFGEARKWISDFETKK